MEIITDLKESPIVGKEYLVPAIGIREPIFEEDLWRDDIFLNKDYQLIDGIWKIIKYIPVHYILHKDKSFGQTKAHWHPDLRFTEYDKSYERFEKGQCLDPIFVVFKCIRNKDVGVRVRTMERKVNQYLKKGYICPHKGYDLRQCPIDSDGNVTCPLHGLKFNWKSKKMVKEENYEKDS